MTNREFSTGSVRDTIKGKPRLDLNSPIADRAEGYVNAYGAWKYADRNWEKGQPLMEGPLSSLRRHLDAWEMGEEIDPDSGLPHLWLARWNASALVHLTTLIASGELPASLDDRPLKGSKASSLAMPTETMSKLTASRPPTAVSAAPSATPASAVHPLASDRNRFDCQANGGYYCPLTNMCWRSKYEHHRSCEAVGHDPSGL